MGEDAADEFVGHLVGGLRLGVEGGHDGEDDGAGVCCELHVAQVDAVEGRLSQAEQERALLLEGDICGALDEVGGETVGDAGERAHGAGENNHSIGGMRTAGDAGGDVVLRVVMDFCGVGFVGAEQCINQRAAAGESEFLGEDAIGVVGGYEVDVDDARVAGEGAEHIAGEDGTAGTGDGEGEANVFRSGVAAKHMSIIAQGRWAWGGISGDVYNITNREGMMKTKLKKFTVAAGEKVKLKKWPTRTAPLYESKENYQAMLQEHVAKLSALQEVFYADNRFALLLIFQGMDAAGKDGAIRHVMSGVNPQGCEVTSFKQPSAEELEHDFLWRTTCKLPERGRIGIFNRTYYEEVLIVRVHAKLLKNETGKKKDDRELWEMRYRSINESEAHLHRNGTRVVKIFLHLSREEQKKRFLERIEMPAKNWKLSLADIQERKYWDEYRKAYEECLSETSSKHAPWHVVPADDKKNARLIVSSLVLQAMEEMQLSYPKADAKQKRDLEMIRKELMK